MTWELPLICINEGDKDQSRGERQGAGSHLGLLQQRGPPWWGLGPWWGLRPWWGLGLPAEGGSGRFPEATQLCWGQGRLPATPRHSSQDRENNSPSYGPHPSLRHNPWPVVAVVDPWREGMAPRAMLRGCSEEMSAEIPALTAGWLARKRQEGPLLSPALWKAQKVCIFTLFNEE